MKLKVKKDGGWIDIELETSTNKKPMAFKLNEAQMSAVVQLIQTALRADSVILQLEI